MSCGVYARLLGSQFEALPTALRRIHDGGARRFSGRCDVVRGTGWLARFIAIITRLPPTQANAPITVQIDRSRDGETWLRRFDGRSMRSFVRARGELLEERLGPVALCFRLSAAGDRIAWRLERVRLLGVRLPRQWFEGCTAVEAIEAGRYSFDVSASMKGAGTLVRYRGWLIEDGA